VAAPRAVLVHRHTEHDELIARHGTRGQAEFFLRSRGESIEPLVDRHERTQAALRTVLGAIPVDWRRAQVERSELSRFAFSPDDVVLVLGQDGLVANVAKYVATQPVLGVDPLPGSNAGVLVPHRPDQVAVILRDVEAQRAPFAERTMVDVVSDDGQSLVALNELYIGQPGHQSARYTLAWRGRQERQSSSGLIVGTGTGATGWCASIQRASAPGLPLPAPTEAALAWFVREAWPSPTTGADLTAGRVEDDVISLRVESDSLVAFGDGVEDDRLVLSWGQSLRVGVASRTLRTVL
jgi:hypothetical protein